MRLQEVFATILLSVAQDQCFINLSDGPLMKCLMTRQRNLAVDLAHDLEALILVALSIFVAYGMLLVSELVHVSLAELLVSRLGHTAYMQVLAQLLFLWAPHVVNVGIGGTGSRLLLQYEAAL